LGRTGIPIGVDEDLTWERKTVEFSAGDKLVIYTDGITEAKNGNGDFYNEERLLSVIQEYSSDTAYDLQLKILKNVKEYAGNTPQADDIALMILEKEKE
jgi:sigma-B regulation protein RsbU (phosphoserine phosphatase)